MLNPPHITKSQPILSVRQLRVWHALPQTWFWEKTGWLKAVEDINFDLIAGETLGLVGESGCGKSTLARALVGLQPIQSGGLAFMGDNFNPNQPDSLQKWRRNVQMIFQDPLASLSPRQTVLESVIEPLRYLRPDVPSNEYQTRALALLARVGIPSEMAQRYPHEFSGGQCQRIGIARALIVEPKVLICDEAVSALDVSIRLQIIELLKNLQAELGLAMLFIAHDLAIVQTISHRVMVMYLGRIMETANNHHLFNNPRHPYTQALLSAAPIPDPRLERTRKRILLNGELPSPLDPPTGCVFRTRCPIADENCVKVPALRRVANLPQHAACHYAEAMQAALL